MLLNHTQASFDHILEVSCFVIKLLGQVVVHLQNNLFLSVSDLQIVPPCQRLNIHLVIPLLVLSL
jgi:hypothetical protein